MLDVRESQSLDLQYIHLAQKAVNVDGQRMSSQFGIQACDQAPKTMRVIARYAELLFELSIDSLDNLSSTADQLSQGRR